MRDTEGSPSAARLSVMIGLLLLVLLSWPRYQLGGYDTHIAMLALIAGGLAVVSIAYWRRMTTAQRRLPPGLLKRLGVAFGIGCLLLAGWHHVLASTAAGWATVVSHGATAGLLLHALMTGWHARR